MTRDSWRHYCSHRFHWLLPRRVCTFERLLVAYVVKVVVNEVTLCVVILHADRWQITGIVTVIVRIVWINWCHSLIRVTVKHVLWILVEHLTLQRIVQWGWLWWYGLRWVDLHSKFLDCWNVHPWWLEVLLFFQKFLLFYKVNILISSHACISTLVKRCSSNLLHI